MLNLEVRYSRFEIQYSRFEIPNICDIALSDWEKLLFIANCQLTSIINLESRISNLES